MLYDYLEAICSADTRLGTQSLNMADLLAMKGNIFTEMRPSTARPRESSEDEQTEYSPRRKQPPALRLRQLYKGLLKPYSADACIWSVSANVCFLNIIKSIEINETKKIDLEVYNGY